MPADGRSTHAQPANCMQMSGRHQVTVSEAGPGQRPRLPVTVRSRSVKAVLPRVDSITQSDGNFGERSQSAVRHANGRLTLLPVAATEQDDLRTFPLADQRSPVPNRKTRAARLSDIALCLVPAVTGALVQIRTNRGRPRTERPTAVARRPPNTTSAQQRSTKRRAAVSGPSVRVALSTCGSCRGGGRGLVPGHRRRAPRMNGYI